jgi:tryptophanyl-tRNA synthetase
MVIDWLAAGVNPGEATLFIQSRVPEHAELHLLLSMLTPVGWLERVPSYKDQQEKLKSKDLSTFGFLGYPLLQSADILIYRAGLVPVGEDQVSHIELTREVARRFNYIYGREPDFVEKAEAAIQKMGKKLARNYLDLRRRYQEQGEAEAIDIGRELLRNQQNLTVADRERLYGYLEGSTRVVLPEPEALLTTVPKMPGVDGQKMSKSYNNTITLRETPESVEQKIRKMPTDTQRVRLTDPGDPDRCPVWQLHQIYTSESERATLAQGCRNATIGCIDCKRPVIDAINAELAPMRARAAGFAENPDAVRQIIADGCEAARDVAKETMEEVRRLMGLTYR